MTVIDLTYDELTKEFEELLTQSTKLEKAPDSTLFDIAGFPHYEDVISNWYAFFLETDKEHGFGNLFLDALLSLIKGKIDTEIELDSCKVNREHPTDKMGFIDLLVYEGMEGGKFINPIIIENKIYAEIYNDLEDYYDSIKAVDDTKIGVALTLKPVEVRDDRYINITHEELLTEIKNNFGDYLDKANPKYLLFLQDFTRNIMNLTKPNQMLNNVKFYYANADKLKSLSEVILNSNRYLYDTLSKRFPHNGWEWGRVGSVAVSIRKPQHLITIYVYYTEVYTENQYKMELWIQNDSVDRWKQVEDKSVLTKKHNSNFNLRTTKNPKEWACLADKTYKITSLDDIEHFSNRVLENLSKDWEPFIEDISDILNKDN